MKHNPLIDAKALEALHTDAWEWALFQCRYERDRAAETLQASYLKVVAGSARFRGESTLRTWLFGVVRLTALEQGRLHARTRPVADDEAVPAEEVEGSDWDPGRAARVAAALAGLSFSQREVVYLVFDRGLTLAESANVLGMQLGTVRTHYDRAKRHLRKHLAAERDSAGRCAS